MTWTEITQEKYYEALEVLPPAVMTGLGFLLGEPETHRTCKVGGFVRATYAAYAEKAGKFYAASESMTVAEFRQMKPQEVS